MRLRVSCCSRLRTASVSAIHAMVLITGLTAIGLFTSGAVFAQDEGAPQMLDPNLSVRTAVSGLITPITVAFTGPNTYLVNEKNTGRVKRVENNVVQGTVLDLAVN